MTSAVRILTPRTIDSSPCLLLIDPDGSKTLVNCGEGCQRSFLEHSQKLASVSRVCLTHLAHDSIGGLPGMILTSADAAKATQIHYLAAQAKQQGKQPPAKKDKKRHINNNSTLQLGELELLGPKGTLPYFRSLRHFMRREEFRVTVREGLYQVAPAVSQEEVSKTNRAKKKKRKSQGNNQDNGNNNDNGAQTTQQSTDNATEDTPSYFGVQTIPIAYQIPTLEAKSEVVSYIFTTPPVPGKFLPDKAKELGIPPGPLYAQLKRGETVTFTDKEGQECQVDPSQVVLETTPGMVVAVLYYPTMEVWQALQPQLNDIFSSSKDNTDETQSAKMELVVHMTTPELLNDPICREWRETLQQAHTAGGDAEPIHHLHLETSDPAVWAPISHNQQHHDSPYTSACIGALVRSQVCPDVYKLPDYLQATSQQEPEKQSDVRTGGLLSEYVLMPRSRKGFNELIATNYLEEQRKEGMQWLQKSGALSHAQELLKDQPTNATSNGNKPSQAELLLTGTGSAIPCKHRNVTGMCLRMDDGRGILLDVGEGTVGQMLRASLTTANNGNGLDAATQQATLLRSIQAAWVSHPHADHHLGLLRLLTERQAAIRHSADANADHPLLVIGPPPILEFLQEYEQVDPRIASSYIPLDCRELVQDPERPRIALPQKMRENSLLHGGPGSITKVEVIPVSHCPYSFAVMLEGTSFGTVAYSGDCRPSKRFAQRAQNADLLIHEATFEDGMEAEATMKKHSTVGEAITIAQEMRAKRLVLTHFSQRYPKIPPVLISSNNGGPTMPVIFAFDFMALTPDKLDVAALLTPSMRRLYPEVDENGSAPPEEEDGAAAAAAAAMSIPGFFAQNPYD